MMRAVLLRSAATFPELRVEATVLAAEVAVMAAVALVLALIRGLWAMGGLSKNSQLKSARGNAYQQQAYDQCSTLPVASGSQTIRLLVGNCGSWIAITRRRLVFGGFPTASTNVQYFDVLTTDSQK